MKTKRLLRLLAGSAMKNGVTCCLAERPASMLACEAEGKEVLSESAKCVCPLDGEKSVIINYFSDR